MEVENGIILDQHVANTKRQGVFHLDFCPGVSFIHISLTNARSKVN